MEPKESFDIFEQKYEIIINFTKKGMPPYLGAGKKELLNLSYYQTAPGAIRKTYMIGAQASVRSEMESNDKPR